MSPGNGTSPKRGGCKSDKATIFGQVKQSVKLGRSMRRILRLWLRDIHSFFHIRVSIVILENIHKGHYDLFFLGIFYFTNNPFCLVKTYTNLEAE